MGKARPGDGWAATWKEPSLYGEERDFTPAPLVKRGSVCAWVAVEEALNPRGLGGIRLYRQDVALSQSGDNLAAFLANSVEIGSASNINRGWVKSLVESLPKKSRVAEAQALETLHAKINALYSCGFLYSGRYQNDPNWAYRLIVNQGYLDEYGFAWVPKTQAEGLRKIEREHLLSATHDYCDVLGTKHDLMTALGLSAVVEADKRWVERGQAYERSRSR